jgi:hypothetical protein
MQWRQASFGFCIAKLVIGCLHEPLSPGVAFPGVSGSAAVGINKGLAPHRLDRQGVFIAVVHGFKSRLFT